MSFDRAGPCFGPCLGLIACLALAACNKISGPFLQVEVQYAASFEAQLAPQVAQIKMEVFDRAGDAGPIWLPPTPITGIYFDGGLLTVRGISGTSVTVLLSGLDVNGKPIASGVQSASLGEGTAPLPIQLAPVCRSDKDCTPNDVCQGLVSCTGLPALGFGSCTAPDAGSAPPPPGTACGPCDAGYCSAGVCQLATCGCAQPLADGGSGYIVDPSIGQVCNTPDNDDFDAGACRTDCQPAHCGDGVLDPGEKCDLGNANGTGVGCNGTCDLLGLVTTLAGSPTSGDADGYGAAASFSRPYGLALQGNQLYVADTEFRSVRVVELDNLGGPAGQPYVQTVAGDHAAGASCIDGDGAATDPAVGFCTPNALLPFDGGLLITDDGALRFLAFSGTLDGGVLSTFGGVTAAGGTPSTHFDAGPLIPTATSAALFGNPDGLALIGLDLYSNTAKGGILGVTPLDQAPLTLAVLTTVGDQFLAQGALAALGSVLYSTNQLSPGALYTFDTANPAQGVTIPPSTAVLVDPDGICSDGKQSIYICESSSGASGGDVRQLDTATGVVTLLAGGHPFPQGGAASQPDGLGADAGFYDPAGCVYDPNQHVLYVSDRSGNEIREIQ